MAATVRIDSEEWYPVYYLSDDQFGRGVEVADEKAAEWRRIRKEFDAMQAEMKPLYRGETTANGRPM